MVKFFALRAMLAERRQLLSDAVQDSLVDAFGMPREKRAHRFFPLDPEDVFAPPDRSSDYLLIEVTLMTGRATATKKALVRGIFDRIAASAGIAQQDVEVVLLEAPPENWGFRGLHGDEAKLNYKVQV